jgi:hypothetical protein
MNKKSSEQSDEQVKTWQSTQYANIVRHNPSGIYYARLRVKGKLIEADGYIPKGIGSEMARRLLYF